MSLRNGGGDKCGSNETHTEQFNLKQPKKKYSNKQRHFQIYCFSFFGCLLHCSFFVSKMETIGDTKDKHAYMIKESSSYTLHITH